MRYRKLDSLGDYLFGNGQIDFWKDTPNAVAQSVQTRLQLWLGEWFLNIEEGTPFMQGILGKYSKDVADTTIKDRVLDTDGVTSIDSYESTIDPDTRSLSVTIKINTIYGPTEVQVANYANY